MTDLSLEPVVYNVDLVQSVNTVDLSSPGPQGVQGQDGLSGGSYTHIQGIASDEWTINHNLGFNPGGIIVLDSAGTVVEGSYEFPNVNRVIATFTSGFSGNAYLS